MSIHGYVHVDVLIGAWCFSICRCCLSYACCLLSAILFYAFWCSLLILFTLIIVSCHLWYCFHAIFRAVGFIPTLFYVCRVLPDLPPYIISRLFHIFVCCSFVCRYSVVYLLMFYRAAAAPISPVIMICHACLRQSLQTLPLFRCHYFVSYDIIRRCFITLIILMPCLSSAFMSDYCWLFSLLSADSSLLLLFFIFFIFHCRRCHFARYFLPFEDATAAFSYCHWFSLFSSVSDRFSRHIYAAWLLSLFATPGLQMLITFRFSCLRRYFLFIAIAFRRFSLAVITPLPDIFHAIIASSFFFFFLRLSFHTLRRLLICLAYWYSSIIEVSVDISFHADITSAMPPSFAISCYWLFPPLLLLISFCWWGIDCFSFRRWWLPSASLLLRRCYFRYGFRFAAFAIFGWWPIFCYCCMLAVATTRHCRRLRLRLPSLPYAFLR